MGAWITAQANPPVDSDWYLVVVVGHGKKRIAVDYYDSDDFQWREEYRDSDVVVMWYKKLPALPTDV